MTQLRAVPLTLEMPPPRRGQHAQSRSILYPALKLVAIKVRGLTAGSARVTVKLCLSSEVSLVVSHSPVKG